MNKRFFIILILVLGLFITGCNKENNTNKTIALDLCDKFESEIKNNDDIISTLNNISSNLDLMLDISEIKDENELSNLSGFDKKIENFNSVYVMRPMIGSIPFIAYVFNTDSPNKLESELKTNANLRWNICTEADSMETRVVGNNVFFIMSPNSFE